MALKMPQYRNPDVPAPGNYRDSLGVNELGEQGKDFARRNASGVGAYLGQLSGIPGGAAVGGAFGNRITDALFGEKQGWGSYADDPRHAQEAQMEGAGPEWEKYQQDHAIQGDPNHPWAVEQLGQHQTNFMLDRLNSQAKKFRADIPNISDQFGNLLNENARFNLESTKQGIRAKQNRMGGTFGGQRIGQEIAADQQSQSDVATQRAKVNFQLENQARQNDENAAKAGRSLQQLRQNYSTMLYDTAMNNMRSQAGQWAGLGNAVGDIGGRVAARHYERNNPGSKT